MARGLVSVWSFESSLGLMFCRGKSMIISFVLIDAAVSR